MRLMLFPKNELKFPINEGAYASRSDGVPSRLQRSRVVGRLFANSTVIKPDGRPDGSAGCAGRVSRASDTA